MTARILLPANLSLVTPKSSCRPGDSFPSTLTNLTLSLLPPQIFAVFYSLSSHPHPSLRTQPSLSFSTFLPPLTETTPKTLPVPPITATLLLKFFSSLFYFHPYRLRFSTFYIQLYYHPSYPVLLSCLCREKGPAAPCRFFSLFARFPSVAILSSLGKSTAIFPFLLWVFHQQAETPPRFQLLHPNLSSSSSTPVKQHLQHHHASIFIDTIWMV